MQGGLLGAQAFHLGLAASQGGVGGAQILLAGAGDFFAGGPHGQQLGVARGLGLCVLLAGLCVFQGSARALHGSGLGALALVQIDRIHFAQHLSGGDALTHFDRQTQHAARHGGADVVGGTCLYRANAEQGRRDGLLPGCGHSDRDRGEWP